MAKKKAKNIDTAMLDDAQKAYLDRIASLVKEDEDFRALLLRVQNVGKNYVGQTSRIETKDYDPKFVEMLEKGFNHIDVIIAKPRSFIKEAPTVMDAGRAKKINSQTVVHLASHTQFVYDIDQKTGDVTPMKLLSIESDVDYGIYENRFIMTLIKKCAIFIERRVNYIRDHGETRDSDLLLLHSSTDVDGATYEVDSRVKVSIPSLDDGNAAKNEDLLLRLYALRERCAYYIRSPFMELMKGQKEVANPIHMTNMIVKNPDYKACYALWAFLDNYLDLGVRYNVTEIDQTYDDEYFQAIYSVLVAEMLTLRSNIAKNRRIEGQTKEKKKRVIPKVMFTLEDETYYDGKFLYDAFPDFRPDPDTPLMPTPEECKKERERLEQKRDEDLIRKGIVEDAIEAQKQKDIIEEAARRKEKEDAEEAAQLERMRLAAIEEARRRAEEEEARRLAELERRKKQDEEMQRLRALVRRQAELDKLGYRQSDFPTHIEDGYGSPGEENQLASGQFASPLPDLAKAYEAFEASEKRKAEEKLLREEQERYERLKEAYEEKERRTLSQMGYRPEEIPSNFENGAFAMEALNCFTPSFDSPLPENDARIASILQKEQEAFDEKEALRQETLAERVKKVQVEAARRRIAERGLSEDYPVHFQDGEYAFVQEERPTPDFASPYHEIPSELPMEEPLVPEEEKFEEPEQVIPPVIEEEPVPAPEEEEEEASIPEEEGKKSLDIVRKSFLEKLASGDDDLRALYWEIHNYIESYDVQLLSGEKGETAYQGRKKLLLLAIAGKRIRLSLALNVEDYPDSPMPLEHTKGRLGVSLPLSFRLKSDLSVRRGKKLIDDLMEKYGIEKKKVEAIAPTYRYKPTYIPEAPTPDFASPIKKIEVEPEPVAPAPAPAPIPAPAPVVAPAPAGDAAYLDIQKKPFREKYLGAEQDTKDKIDALRNYLSEYDLTERVSAKGDLYSAHRKKLAFLALQRNSIKLSLALDPEEFKDSPIPVEVNSSSKKADTPLLFRVKSDLSLRRAYSLIDQVMEENGVNKLPTPFALADLNEALPEEEKEATPAPVIAPVEEPVVQEESVPEEAPIQEVPTPAPEPVSAPTAEGGFSMDIQKKPFSDKYLDAEPETREKVDSIRNYLAGYDLTERVSAKGDLYSAHRKKLAFLALQRNSIKLSLALDPEAFKDSPIPVEVNSSSKKADTPLLFRVKSDLSLRRAYSLIDQVMEENGIKKLDKPFELATISASEVSPKEATPVAVIPQPEPVLEEFKSAPVEPAPAPSIEPIVAPIPSEGGFSVEIKKTPFDEKYLQLDPELKAKFDAIREYVASYDVTERVSIKGDLFSARRNRLLFLTLSRQHIKVSLALDINDYADSSIPLEKNTSSKLSDTPTLLRVKSDLSLRRAYSLIDDVMNKFGVSKASSPKELQRIVKEKKEKPVEEKAPVLKTPAPVAKPVEPKPEPKPVEVPVVKPSVEGEGLVPEIKKTPFPEKFAQLDPELKEKFMEIRKKLAEYELSERISIKGDLFSAHRVRYAFLQLGRKTIKVSLNLPVDNYNDSTFPIETNKGSKLSDTPLLFRVRSDLSLRRALSLIEDMAELHGLKKRDVPGELEEIY